jgi:hypothetical protein
MDEQHKRPTISGRAQQQVDDAQAEVDALLADLIRRGHSVSSANADPEVRTAQRRVEYARRVASLCKFHG